MITARQTMTHAWETVVQWASASLVRMQISVKIPRAYTTAGMAVGRSATRGLWRQRWRRRKGVWLVSLGKMVSLGSMRDFVSKTKQDGEEDTVLVLDFHTYVHKM